MSNKQPPKLSIALIVRNAGVQLRDTLASVRCIADELVVLDTGSTDDILRIAADCGAAIHKQSWDDSFAAARNACLERCTGDWVLWIDAGERLASASADELRHFVNSQADLTCAYLLPIAVMSNDREAHASRSPAVPVEQVYQCRLHPRLPGLQFAGRVRESLDSALATAGLSLATLPIAIERSAADRDPLTRTAKAQRNIRLADRSLAEQGPSADMHNCLAEALQTLGDHLRAAHQYQRAIRLATPGSREQLEAYYGLLACLDSAGPDRDAQLSLCMEALDRFPLDAQLLVALGSYLQALSQTPLAIRAYDVAFRHGQIEPRIPHLPNVPEIAAVCASALMQLAGDNEAALTLLEAAVRTHPQSLRIGRQHVELLVKLGRRDEALAAARSLPIEDRAREAWAVAVRGACAAGQAQWVTARAHLQLAYESGCHERFCLRWLVVSHLRLGEVAEAASVLESWRRFDQDNPEIAELAQAVAERQEISGTAHSETPVVNNPVGGKPVVRIDQSTDKQPILRVVPANVAAKPGQPSGR